MVLRKITAFGRCSRLFLLAFVLFCYLISFCVSVTTGIDGTHTFPALPRVGLGLPIDLGINAGLRKYTTMSKENVDQIVKGVENGSRDSMYFFGLLKLYGIVLSKSEVVGAQYIKKAADLDHMDATTAYGVLLLHGTGVDPDPALAQIYLRKGVQMNDGNAYWLLGQMLMEYYGTNREKQREAVSLFRLGAEQRIPQAQHLLAVMYEYGQGIEKNSAEARSYYRRAAEQGYAESQYNLGLMYAFGRGDTPNYLQAMSLWERAAQDSNHGPSMYYMGICYLYGYDVMPNYNTALGWFERAAAVGDIRVDAQARKAVSELTQLMEIASIRNEAVVEKYRKMSEERR